MTTKTDAINYWVFVEEKLHMGGEPNFADKHTFITFKCIFRNSSFKNVRYFIIISYLF